MTFTPIRAAATAILGTVLGGGLACTAILAPRDDVERCANTDECPPSGDPRIIYECRFDPDRTDLDTLNVDKVCIPAHARVGCALPNDPEDPYRAMFDRRARAINYLACSETPGAQGCPPDAGVCNDGLAVRDDGICDDNNPDTPPAFGFVSAQFDSQSFFGQDVKDQYCRSFFCDDRFVCDTGDNQCRLCDPNRKIGEGGCGEIYSAGKPSCVYHRGAELDAACRGTDSRANEPQFGDCSEVVDPTDDTGPTDDTSDPSDTTAGDHGMDDTGTTGDETGTTGDDMGTTGVEETTTE